MKILNRSGGLHRGPERRSGADRRQLEKGPPGRSERRKGLGPRKPEVSVLELTESEWASLTQEPEAPAASHPGPPKR
jgi:hypothetical protein